MGIGAEGWQDLDFSEIDLRAEGWNITVLDDLPLPELEALAAEARSKGDFTGLELINEVIGNKSEDVEGSGE